MLLSQLFDELAADLAGPGVPPARADARDLIAAILDKPKFWPTANQSLELDRATEEAIRKAGARMMLGMPMQYAVGRAAFRHLELKPKCLSNSSWDWRARAAPQWTSERARVRLRSPSRQKGGSTGSSPRTSPRMPSRSPGAISGRSRLKNGHCSTSGWETCWNRSLESWHGR